jgi:hypothetical protein
MREIRRYRDYCLEKSYDDELCRLCLFAISYRLDDRPHTCVFDVGGPPPCKELGCLSFMKKEPPKKRPSRPKAVLQHRGKA